MGAFPRLWHRSRRRLPSSMSRPPPPTPPGCHIPPEAASLLATLTPPLPAVLPAVLRCPRPAHVCVHVRAARSPPAFCTRGGLHFPPGLFPFCTCGWLHLAPDLFPFCTGGSGCVFYLGCFQFALIAVAFCTGEVCILHQGYLHFSPGTPAFCTRDACFMDQ